MTIEVVKSRFSQDLLVEGGWGTQRKDVFNTSMVIPHTPFLGRASKQQERGIEAVQGLMSFASDAETSDWSFKILDK